MPDRLKDKIEKNNKSQRAFEYLVNQKGYTPVMAAGIVGNLKQESSFSTTARNPNDPGTSFGLAQWNRDRKEKLFKMYGDNPSFTDQLDYIDWELNNTESKALNELKKAQNPAQAAVIFSNYYERPAKDKDINRNDLRAAYASNAFNTFLKDQKNKQYRETWFGQTGLTNLEDAQEKGNFVPQKYFEYVLNTPVETEEKEGEPKKEVVSKNTENKETVPPAWKANLQKEINKRNFLLDLISSGYIDYKRPEYDFRPYSTEQNSTIMQSGGQIPVATTPEQQYNGLNNNPNEQMYFPMEGTNTFRGLDNGQPVQVTDKQGNTKVLIGNKDTAQFTGDVYEQKMQKGGKLQMPTFVPVAESTNSGIQQTADLQRSYNEQQNPVDFAEFHDLDKRTPSEKAAAAFYTAAQKLNPKGNPIIEAINPLRIVGDIPHTASSITNLRVDPSVDNAKEALKNLVQLGLEVAPVGLSKRITPIVAEDIENISDPFTRMPQSIGFVNDKFRSKALPIEEGKITPHTEITYRFPNNQNPSLYYKQQDVFRKTGRPFTFSDIIQEEGYPRDVIVAGHKFRLNNNKDLNRIKRVLYEDTKKGADMGISYPTESAIKKLKDLHIREINTPRDITKRGVKSEVSNISNKGLVIPKSTPMGYERYKADIGFIRKDIRDAYAKYVNEQKELDSKIREVEATIKTNPDYYAKRKDFLDDILRNFKYEKSKSSDIYENSVSNLESKLTDVKDYYNTPQYYKEK